MRILEFFSFPAIILASNKTSARFQYIPLQAEVSSLKPETKNYNIFDLALNTWHWYYR